MTSNYPKTYACVDCGRPLADFTPCPDCGGTRIDVQSADGQNTIVGYYIELAHACALSRLPPEQIYAFEFGQARGRTRCIIWRLVGDEIEKHYFYGPQKEERHVSIN